MGGIFQGERARIKRRKFPPVWERKAKWWCGGKEDGQDQLNDHPACAAIRALNEVCQWLAIFFRAKDGTREACHAGCLGALSGLAEVTGEGANVWAIGMVRESAGKMAKTLYSQIMQDDPDAARRTLRRPAAPRTGHLA